MTGWRAPEADTRAGASSHPCTSYWSFVQCTERAWPHAGEEQRVAVVDVASRKLRLVTPADMYVYHFDWSPDGTRLAAVAAPGSGDNNYWIAQLHVVDVAAATMKSVYKPQLQIAKPRWSPDGKRIAFIEGLMSDEGSTGGDLFVLEGATARNVKPNVKATVTTFEWTGADQI